MVAEALARAERGWQLLEDERPQNEASGLGPRGNTIPAPVTRSAFDI